MTEKEKLRIRQSMAHFASDEPDGWSKGMDILYELAWGKNAWPKPKKKPKEQSK